MRKSSDQRRSEFVTAAVGLADSLGPERLTTATVAQAIGMSQAALFKHFPSKDSLWQAIAEWIGVRLESCWGEALVDAGGASDALARLLAAHLALVARTPGIPAIVFSRGLHQRSELLRRALFEVMHRFHRRIAAILEQGRGNEFRADLDPSAAAFLVIGLVQGLVIRWSLSGRGIDLPAEGAAMLAMLLRGFLPEAQGGEGRDLETQGDNS